MFIYLVAVVATLFLIFGLVHAKCLPVIERSLNDLENTVTTERPVTVTNERMEYEELPIQRPTFTNKERLSDAILAEAGSRARNLSPPRYSFENILSEEKDKHFGLPGLDSMRPLQLGTTQDGTIRTPKQEEKENVFESLKSSIERTSTSPYSRLNTSQIYNMILKEKLKENAAKQKVLENDRSKFSEPLTIKTTEHVPTASETTSKFQDDNHQDKSSKSNN